MKIEDAISKYMNIQYKNLYLDIYTYVKEKDIKKFTDSASKIRLFLEKFINLIMDKSKIKVSYNKRFVDLINNYLEIVNNEKAKMNINIIRPILNSAVHNNEVLNSSDIFSLYENINQFLQFNFEYFFNIKITYDKEIIKQNRKEIVVVKEFIKTNESYNIISKNLMKQDIPDVSINLEESLQFIKNNNLDLDLHEEIIRKYIFEGKSFPNTKEYFEKNTKYQKKQKFVDINNIFLNYGYSDEIMCFLQKNEISYSIFKKIVHEIKQFELISEIYKEVD